MSARGDGIRWREDTGRWQISYYDHKRRIYEHAPQGASYAEARKLRTQRLREVDTGTYQPRTSVTVSTLCGLYLAEMRQTGSLAPSTVALRSLAFRRLAPFVGHITIAELTAEHVAAARDGLLEESWHDSRTCAARVDTPGPTTASSSAAAQRRPRRARMGTGSAPAKSLTARTVSRYLEALRAALNWAVGRGLLVRNVTLVRGLLPKAEDREMTALDQAQASRLLRVLRNHDDPYARILAVALLTGLRCYSELGAMRRSDVDLERGVYSLAQVLVKNVDEDGMQRNGSRIAPAGNSKHKRRPIDLTPTAVALLREQMTWGDRVMRKHYGPADDLVAERGYRQWQKDGLVFVDQYGSHVNEPTLQWKWKRWLAEAELPSTVKVHDLRHTWATLALLNGVHVKVVSDVLGHSKIGMTLDVYGHVLAGMGRDAMDTVAALMEVAQ